VQVVNNAVAANFRVSDGSYGDFENAVMQAIVELDAKPHGSVINYSL
jgi:hypothetical protein